MRQPAGGGSPVGTEGTLSPLAAPRPRAGGAGRRYLLTQGAVTVLLQAVQLEGLPQEWIEGFAGAEDGGGVGGDSEGSHVAELLQRALAFGRAVEQLVVLQVLRQPLQHGERLIEVHLQGEELRSARWDGCQLGTAAPRPDALWHRAGCGRELCTIK